MITKEAVIAEIDQIPPKDLETVYKLIKVFTRSTQDLLQAADNTPRTEGEQAARRLGGMRDSVKILGDIITPIMDETQWEACNA